MERYPKINLTSEARPFEKKGREEEGCHLCDHHHNEVYSKAEAHLDQFHYNTPNF